MTTHKRSSKALKRPAQSTPSTETLYDWVLLPTQTLAVIKLARTIKGSNGIDLMLTAIRCDLPSDASIIVSMMSAPWEPFEIQKDFFGVGVDSGDRAILRSLSAKCKQSLIDAIKTNYTKTVAGLDDMAVTAVELTGLFR